MAYSTKQRKLILNLLSEQGSRHLTAEEIAAELKPHGVGKATVYRYLDILLETGRVRKYAPQDGGSACYQFVGDEEEKRCKNHFHLKCGDCGKLLHIECNYLSGVESHIKSRHCFNIDNTKTVFYGKCAHCDNYDKAVIKEDSF